MIKLNNKNITYVALADSNNSLKAPKEIWYADSNNSVKLVYQRKDALIEGEDYEKYHWLVSNSEDSKTPYIDTLILPNLNQNISFSFKVINSNTNGGEPGIWGAILGTSWNNCVIRCFKHKSYGYTILEFNNNNVDFPLKENMIIKTEFSEGKEYDCSLSINSSTTALGVINNESKELVANSNVNFVLNPQPTHKLFVESNNTSWSFNSVGFKKFNITNLISLVPCKLLKPVPKWLDANGIRRQVGECGMIDLVSGKFYGNVNSVGTFTVENYYERKEWLVGDGSAYIDTGHNVNEDLDYETKVHLLPNTYLFWYRTNGTTKDNTMVIRSDSNIWVGPRIAKNSGNIQLNDTDGELEIQWNGRTVSINGIDYNIITKVINLSSELYLFHEYLADTVSSYTSNNVKCAYFRFLDSNRNYIQNLIPCTLTMDLPASMDANNIARTKGTSGMWDLVSDKFYGNVASSGTFKAVNLAEGVDYEVHQWLCGRNGAYIDTNYYITTYEDVFEGKCKYDGTLRNPNGREQDVYGTMDSDNNVIGGYIATTNKFAIFYHKTINDVWMHCTTALEHTFIAYASGSKFYATDNGSQFEKTNNNLPQKTFSDSLYLFSRNKASANYFHGDIAYFKITDTSSNTKMDLIPVKLLKSIPSKYDANGIARNAGECGMYDTVNDKFYGNVASSGSFTVSDDN